MLFSFNASLRGFGIFLAVEPSIFVGDEDRRKGLIFFSIV
jgi:hypothetical protein